MGAVKTWVDVFTSVESHNILCAQGIFHKKSDSEDILLPKGAIAPEDDWEEVPSDDEASSAEQDAPSAEQDAPSAEQDAPQERGCNDCGYIACSQDCGMRNFD
jgi:hypothetical protein